MRRTIFTLAAAFALILATSSASARVFVDFNEASDLDDFNIEGGTSIIGSGGVGDSGYMVSTSNAAGNGAAYTAQTWNLTNVGQTLTYSVFILIDKDVQTNSNTGDDRQLWVGFRESLGGGLDPGNASDAILFGVQAPSQTTYQFEIKGREGGSNRDRTSSGTFSLTDTHWYRLDTTFTLASATSWQVDGTLTDFGTDGQTLGTQVESYSLTVNFNVDATLGTDALIALGMAENDRYGINGYDNLDVVPEPAAAGLLGLGALALIRRRRRA